MLLCCPKSHLEKLYAHLPPLRGDNIFAKGLAPKTPCFQSCLSPRGPRFCHLPLEPPNNSAIGSHTRFFLNCPITSWPFSFPNHWPSNSVLRLDGKQKQSHLLHCPLFLLGAVIFRMVFCWPFPKLQFQGKSWNKSSHASERKPLLSLHLYRWRPCSHIWWHFICKRTYCEEGIECIEVKNKYL